MKNTLILFMFYILSSCTSVPQNTSSRSLANEHLNSEVLYNKVRDALVASNTINTSSAIKIQGQCATATTCGLNAANFVGELILLFSYEYSSTYFYTKISNNLLDGCITQLVTKDDKPVKVGILSCWMKDGKRTAEFRSIYDIATRTSQAVQ